MIPLNLKLLLSVPLLVILAACAGRPESSVSTPTSTATAERASPTEQPAKEVNSGELPNDVATRYMYDLSSRDRELGAAALEAVLEAKDQRFIAVLIEVIERATSKQAIYRHKTADHFRQALTEAARDAGIAPAGPGELRSLGMRQRAST